MDKPGMRDISISINLVGSVIPMKIPEAKEENLLSKFIEVNFEKKTGKLHYAGIIRAMEAAEVTWEYSVATIPLNIDHIMYNFYMRRFEANFFVGQDVEFSSKLKIQFQAGLINALDRETIDRFQYLVINGVLNSGEVMTSKIKTYYDFGGQGNLRLIYKLSSLVQLNLFGGYGIFTDARQRIEAGLGIRFSF